jgi:WD40 repeat protein
MDRQGGQKGLSFLADDYHIVVAGYDDILRKYILGRKDGFSDLHHDKNTFSPIQLKSVSDYGNLLFYKNSNGFVCINTDLTKEIFKIKNGDIPHAQFSSNDEYLGIGDINAKSIVLSTKSGETVWESQQDMCQQFLCFSPDNKNFITSSRYCGKLEIWDTRTWTKISESKDDVTYNQFYIGAYSPNRKILATAPGPYSNGVIHLWDTVNFTVIGQVLSPHGTRVHKIKFTFDNNELITIGDKDIIIWQIIEEQTTTKNVEVNVRGDANNSNIVIGDDNEVESRNA